MSTVQRLHKLGDNTDRVLVIEVFCKVGDSINQGQALFMVETDKVTVEVEAEANGTILEIHVCEDDEVAVGDPLVTFTEGSGV